MEGNPEAALAELQQETPALSLKGRALANHALKRHDESDAALARLISGGGSIAPMSIAQVYAFRGQIDEAFEWLERAIAQKEVTTGHIKGDPLLSPLVADPRYARCLRKMNLPDGGRNGRFGRIYTAAMTDRCWPTAGVTSNGYFRPFSDGQPA